MVRSIPEPELQPIEIALRRFPEGASAKRIQEALGTGIPIRTLQHQLGRLVARNRVIREGVGRGVRYRLPVETPSRTAGSPKDDESSTLPLSASASDILAHVHQPLPLRKPVGYNRRFLESYRPNVTFYLSEAERARLWEIGKPPIGDQPAGTYAKTILDRVLIDLSWNSSRLEGNTYSLLDTKRLIERGEQVEGRGHLEAQMILNHKDAIEFLVRSADDIGFNRYTILNLHAALANNLLPDPAAVGRLRRIPVGIERSVFHPLEVPQLIDECFDGILAAAEAIRDPFEQAFFAMVQLPYFQPFDDVNKRVSRLAANIPFIRGNLSPLSFTDVPRGLYTDATLGVYELNRVELLRDVFLWAYERSAARYAAVRQSLGEPDPFRLRHRDALREIVGEVIRRRMDRKEAAAHIAQWTASRIDHADRERFVEIAETELLSLHEGNFARYRVRPSEFTDWQASWRRS